MASFHCGQHHVRPPEPGRAPGAATPDSRVMPLDRIALAFKQRLLAPPARLTGIVSALGVAPRPARPSRKNGIRPRPWLPPRASRLTRKGAPGRYGSSSATRGSRRPSD